MLIIFKRQKSLAAQLEILRAIRPAKVYVFADGPRNEADAAACLQARAIIDSLDWPCTMQRQFMGRNLGCGKGPANAIDWFFAHEPEGIILEDDLLPHPDFFPFCAEMLERFRDDPRVMEICGPNRLGQWGDGTCSYHFSHWGLEWGWATWRRAWRHIDFTVRAWADPEVRRRIRNIYRGPLRAAFLARILGLTYADPGAVSWWDYQWVFARNVQGSLAVVPSTSLMQNVSCDEFSYHDHDAPHTFAALKKLPD